MTVRSSAIAATTLSVLESVVGSANVLRDPEIVRSYETDWTGRFCGSTHLVVRPGRTEEVSAVVATCAAEGIALTIQGGNTGLVGGSVPLQGECVLSLRRLNSVCEVDGLSGQLTAGAGATVAAVQNRAREAGWDYGVDLGSRDSATIGGTVATNAGGLHVLRHGNTRAQLLGVEAVLGDGAVVSHLGGLPKDNTGYDLAGLLCGSEGTLGVVTGVRLRLVPAPRERTVVLLAFESVDAAVKAVSDLRRKVRSLEALEMFLHEGLELVCSTFSIDPPFGAGHPVYLLAEAADETDPTEALSEAVSSIEGVVDVAVALEPERRAALWRYREGHTEAINSLGAPHKLDVSLPMTKLAEFIREVRKAAERVAPGSALWLFGHLGDGNVHVNVTGVEPEDDTVDDAVFRLAAEMGGSISAEHGIGVAKRRWLSLNRSSAEIDTYRAIKRALDPAGILNPNVLL
ncbi:MAG: FAD-binding oxidoreductase [Acidimicrobiales bacterium]